MHCMIYFYLLITSKTFIFTVQFLSLYYKYLNNGGQEDKIRRNIEEMFYS